MDKIPVLVSECLLGVPCRYHGRDCVYNSRLRKLAATGKYRFVPICPEVDAGMPVPRPPTRSVDGVLTCGGEDVTCQFVQGARMALDAAIDSGAEKAYMVRGSPSCDKDKGVAALLLRQHGIKVVSV